MRVRPKLDGQRPRRLIVLEQPETFAWPGITVAVCPPFGLGWRRSFFGASHKPCGRRLQRSRAPSVAAPLERLSPCTPCAASGPRLTVGMEEALNHGLREAALDFLPRREAVYRTVAAQKAARVRTVGDNAMLPRTIERVAPDFVLGLQALRTAVRRRDRRGDRSRSPRRTCRSTARPTLAPTTWSATRSRRPKPTSNTMNCSSNEEEELEMWRAWQTHLMRAAPRRHADAVYGHPRGVIAKNVRSALLSFTLTHSRNSLSVSLSVTQ